MQFAEKSNLESESYLSYGEDYGFDFDKEMRHFQALKLNL